MRIAIINGPNLNLLGKREPDIYGKESFEDFFKKLKMNFQSHELDYFQSNHEGDLIDFIHKVGFNFDAIVVNPAAYSHTSIGIRDALASVSARVIEVHISNIFKRESFRHHSYISSVAEATLCGFGLNGYRLAMLYLINESD